MHLSRLSSLIHPLAIAGVVFAAAPLFGDDPESPERQAVEALIERVRSDTPRHDDYLAMFPRGTELLELDANEDTITLIFNQALTERPWFSQDHDDLLNALRFTLADTMGERTIEVLVRESFGRRSIEWPLEEYVTDSERIHARQDDRTAGAAALEYPVAANADYAGPNRELGLAGRHLFVSASHGWTWHQENRWQFQRARLFTTIEDLFPMSYINPFLIPMLENAGGVVFSARERDFQTAEVIVDNDAVTPRSRFRTSGEWELGAMPGWQGGRPAVLAEDVEPFTLGTTLRTEVRDGNDSAAHYLPYIPRPGRYAVYASWAMSPANSPSVPIHVNHLGGTTTFRVNQQVAGNTWVFLGFFEFDQGTDAERGSVIITAEGALPRATEDDEDEAPRRTFVSVDAVRFGGGMGNIAPDDMVSGRPRFAESSRYWAQYAGAPAREVYLRGASPGHFGVDYNRDVLTRPEWANFINGAPNGPNDFRNMRGLGVPIDMMYSWHTDAGHREDGIVGTLSIYRLWDEEGSENFPDGRSRQLNRDLTVLVHDEIMRTARGQYTSTWAGRQIWNRSYGEIRRPNVPSTLLELLAHQNFNDMKYGLDPRFQHDIARAVYKGILRFVAYSHGYEPVVQPLAPYALAVRHEENGTALLTWLPKEDRLEPSATPDGYIVYTSRDGRSFDNGRYVEDNTATITDLEADTNYYFRVTAANAGGESLPSSVVGVRWSEGRESVLIVDGFDRVAPPAAVHEDGTRGFDIHRDPGVGYHYNYGLVGPQYDFDPDSDWENDLESPGRGGSQSIYETRLLPGNSFDHIVRHGELFAALDIPFDSATAAAFAGGAVGELPTLIDWIAGRQKATPPPPGMEGEGAPDRMQTEFPVLAPAARERLRAHLDNGGKLIVSGAYIGEDLIEGPLAGTESRAFAREYLGIEAVHSRATTVNAVRPADADNGFAPFRFGRDLEPPIHLEPGIYPVPSAEGFEVADIAETPLLYGDTQHAAGIVTERAALLGFPLETVLPMEAREALLRSLLDALMEE